MNEEATLKKPYVKPTIEVVSLTTDAPLAFTISQTEPEVVDDDLSV